MAALLKGTSETSEEGLPVPLGRRLELPGRGTTFVREVDGSWRRDDERHDNVMVDASAIPALLIEHGVEATVQSAFGDEDLPVGLKAVVGLRPA